MNEVVKRKAQTVLIVEDSDDTRLLATELLRRSGYQVACAVNGAEALDYLHTHAAPDAILLDMRMPVMDGRQFLGFKNGEPRLAAIPVVIYSAEGQGAVTTPGVVRSVAKTSPTQALLDAVFLAVGKASVTAVH